MLLRSFKIEETANLKFSATASQLIISHSADFWSSSKKQQFGFKNILEKSIVTMFWIVFKHTAC